MGLSPSNGPTLIGNLEKLGLQPIVLNNPQRGPCADRCTWNYVTSSMQTANQMWRFSFFPLEFCLTTVQIAGRVEAKAFARVSHFWRKKHSLKSRRSRAAWLRGPDSQAKSAPHQRVVGVWVGVPVPFGGTACWANTGCCWNSLWLEHLLLGMGILGILFPAPWPYK